MASRSSERSTALGWMVAVTSSASSESRARPRLRVSRKLGPEQRLRRGRAQQTRPSAGRELGLEPGTARLDLGRGGLSWIRRLPRAHLKCLTTLVTYVSAGRSRPASSARSSSCPAGPTNGRPCEILLVARLLADQHQPRRARALAEHGLGRVPIERAGLAARGGRTHGGQLESRSGHERRRGRVGIRPWHGQEVPGAGRVRCGPRGALAEWLGRGLQSLVHQFESGRRLYCTGSGRGTRVLQTRAPFRREHATSTYPDGAHSLTRPPATHFSAGGRRTVSY